MFRTGYSFRFAVGKLDDVLARFKTIGMTEAPIADRLSTFAFAKFTKAAHKAGLRPVYGVELPVTLSKKEAMPSVDWWTFLAMDDIAALNDLIWEATRSHTKEPMLEIADAIAAPGVIKIAGPSANIDRIDEQGVFLGLSPATPRGVIKRAIARQVPLMAMSYNLYTNAADREFFRITLGRNQNDQTFPQHILSDQEWHEAVQHLVPDAEMRAQALANRSNILATCKAKIKKATLLIPKKPFTLRQLCEAGAKKLKVDLSNKVYAERLDRELALITEKKFEDYFFIIADMVNWAKEIMVCGPARGSSCGSLVCYLLGITSIDPIPFNLLFERFIDTTRSDLPDIDLDFSDLRRHKVFKYVEDKYGENRVARLGSVGTFMPRSALHQAGIALRIPRFQIDKVLDNIIVRSSGDSRALQQLEDTLKDTAAGRILLNDFPNVTIAQRLEGHPNVPGQHAAGIVLTQEPVRTVVAMDARTRSTMCDKRDAEDLNLLKIDALGLTQLSIFERTLQLIKQPDCSGYLETLPLDDPLAFEVLNRGHFSGIFQFMGGALQSLAKQTTFTSVNDLIAITALARPGPMATGGASAWVKRKRGDEPITFAHPLVEPFLKDTLGIVVYQEQVMQIAREVGDLSWDDVTALRKAMSKSMGEEFFNRYGDPWKKRATEKGMPPEVASKFWDDLCAFGSWGFNKSHAVAYGIVSYWCCWLKAHHQTEFAAATLDAETDPAKQIQLLRELEAEGVKYTAVDPKRSGALWEIAVANDGIKSLVGPLTNIKGIGPTSVRKIVDFRNDEENGKKPKALGKSINSKLKNAKTDIDSLYPISERIKKLHPSLKAIRIFTDPVNIKDIIPGDELFYEVLIIGIAQRIVPRDENELVLISKRGGRKIKGKYTAYLNLFMRDDTDEVYCKIDRFMFPEFGAPILERGRGGKALYAVKGTVPKDFKMIKVSSVRYLGDMEIDE